MARLVRHRVQELQQHSAIGGHRPRDVDQRHQGRPAMAPPAARQQPDVTAVAHGGAHGAAPIGDLAPRIGDLAPRGDGPRRQAHPRDGPLRLRRLGRRHLFEVARFQRLLRRECQRRVVDDLLALGLGARWWGRVESVRQARRSAVLARLFLALGGRGPQFRQDQAHHLLEDLRVTPEHVEALVEDRALLGPAEEAGSQRVIEILAPLEPADADRAHCQDYPARADRQARRTQSPGKMQDVGGKPPVFRDRDLRAHQAAPAAVSVRACLTSSSTLLACESRNRAMSSWYFSSAPRVLETKS